MFIWNLLKGAQPFSKKEDRIVRWLLNVMIRECPKSCSFLLCLPLEKMTFCWSKEMDSFKRNGILGAWSPWTPYKTYLPAIREDMLCCIPESNVSKSGVIKDVLLARKMLFFVEPLQITIIIHELEHWLQFRTSKVLYFINRLVTLFVDHIPFLERIGIEYDARQTSETPEITEFASKLCECVNTLFCAIESKSPDDPNNGIYKDWADPTRWNKSLRKYANELLELINEE